MGSSRYCLRTKSRSKSRDLGFRWLEFVSLGRNGAVDAGLFSMFAEKKGQSFFGGIYADFLGSLEVMSSKF